MSAQASRKQSRVARGTLQLSSAWSGTDPCPGGSLSHKLGNWDLASPPLPVKSNMPSRAHTTCHHITCQSVMPVQIKKQIARAPRWRASARAHVTHLQPARVPIAPRSCQNLNPNPETLHLQPARVPIATHERAALCSPTPPLHNVHEVSWGEQLVSPFPPSLCLSLSVCLSVSPFPSPVFPLHPHRRSPRSWRRQ